MEKHLEETQNKVFIENIKDITTEILGKGLPIAGKDINSIINNIIKEEKYKNQIKLLLYDEIEKEIQKKYSYAFEKFEKTMKTNKDKNKELEEQYNSQKSSMEKEIKKLNSKKQEAIKIIENSKEKEEYFDELEREIKKLENDKKVLSSDIQNFSNIKKILEKKESQIKDLDKDLIELENKKNNYNKIIEEGRVKEQKINIFNEELLRLESKVQENSLLEIKVNNLKNEITQLKEAKKTKEKEQKEELEQKYKSLNEDLENQSKIFFEGYEKMKSNKEKTSKLLIEDLENKKSQLYENVKKINSEIFEKQNYFDEMKNKEVELVQREEKVKRETMELEILNNSNDLKKEKLKEIEEELNFEISSRFENRLDNYKSDLEEREEEIRDLKEEVRDLNNKLDMYENDLDSEKLLKKNEVLRKNVKELKEDLFNKKDEVEKELDETKKLKNTLEEKNKDLLKKYRVEEEKAIKLMEYRDNVEQYKELYEDKEGVNILLQNKVEELRENILEIKNKNSSREEKIVSIEQQQFDLVLPLNGTKITEIKWLENILNKFDEIGFKFTKRLLYAFHTSLKVAEWSPLTVLAGVSGTGKSELPKLYSRYGGLYFLPLAVQPDWDSPQSLFGYYNSLEGKFNATTLLKTIYQAQAPKNQDYSLKEYMSLVLLDEMNLAHVELYFSELLSKLEMARGSKKGIDLEVDIADKEPYKVNLNKNILWAGTMNEDETTKTLSDKVIDRGNILNFPKPTNLISRKKLIELPESHKLKKSTWESWKWDSSKEESLEGKIDEYRKALENINKHMEIGGRAIGHRVWQSVENYIKNHPMVMANIDNEEKLNKYVQYAFEDVLVLKVMPKLRGLETNGEVKTECLDKIREVLRDKANGILIDFDKAVNNLYGVFVWSSSEYLGNKDKENGYEKNE